MNSHNDSRDFTARFDKPDFIILAHQRSGTHFLQESLASHPSIYARDECLMHFRPGPAGARDSRLISYSLENRIGACNIAIVMYSQVELFEQTCGSLFDIGIIHLLRNPQDVAFSVAQMKADKAATPNAFRAHYRIGESKHRGASVSSDSIISWHRVVANLQNRFKSRLRNHPRILTIYYEELAPGGRQANSLSTDSATRLLSFLSLPYKPLTNRLMKTSITST